MRKIHYGEYETEGIFTVLSQVDNKSDDLEQSITSVFIGSVDTEERELDRTGRALAEDFSFSCNCEHDCCGHRFYRACAEHIAGNLWKVEVYSSLNF